MASLYPKQRSPFWWIRYRDPKTGEMVNRSTGMRRDDQKQTQEARRMRAQWEAKELGAPAVREGEAWESWVPIFLSARYAQSAPSKQRAETAWKALSTYFRTKGIRAARLLTRAHCAAYMAWRTGEEGVDMGLRKVKHNTALVELKILGTIMREAVERGLASANPCLQLGVKRARGKIKPEITDDEIAKIEAALESERGVRQYNEAMRISWQVATYQLCRLRETCVPLCDVNLVEGTITFRIKGGKDHTALLHPALFDLFRELKATGREYAYEMPKSFAKVWLDFFRRHKMGHLSFHSTRVTGVTRLRRKGVDVRVAMEFVGHSSAIVHQIYQRSRKDDQLAALNALERRPSS